MNIDALTLADLSGTLLGFVLTLFILSYVMGDNALFRLATHIFVGVAAGYATIVTLYNVILPHMVFPILDGGKSDTFLAVSFLIPSLLILAKLSPRLSKLGNPAVAILVGIGAAAAIGGAVTGTLFPQTSAAIGIFETNNFVDGVVIVIGTLSTLLFFQFSTPKDTQRARLMPQVMRVLRWVGKVFVAITFGALFTGVYIAALTALIERFTYLWNIFKELVLPALM